MSRPRKRSAQAPQLVGPSELSGQQSPGRSLEEGVPEAVATAPVCEQCPCTAKDHVLAKLEKDKELLQLRSDLAATGVYLQSLLRDRDLANRELILANEEILSSNEELQSINEELHTAQEELQSTNEKLCTRNRELGQTSDDLLNLLNNITIPVLMLDGELRIRQFTPIAERLMNVRASDVGRPIGEIRLGLSLDDLEPLLREVIATLTSKELEVQDQAGRWYLLRARPYRTAHNKIQGVVLVLVDIDQIRKSQQQVVAARDFAQSVITGAQVPLAALSRELLIKLANRAFFELCGLSAEEVAGRPFRELAVRQWNLQQARSLLESLYSAQASGRDDFELEHELEGPSPQVIRVNVRALLSASEPIILIALQDITAHRQAERVLQQEKERLEGRVLLTERALDRTQEELRSLAVSLFTAQEEERRRVSRELHEDLAQKLALIDVNTIRLQQGLTELSPGVRGQMDELRRQISNLSNDLRRIAYQLHPTILDDLGVGFALKELCAEFSQREGFPVQFSGDTTISVAPIIGGSLYRITQEALRNIAKHAGKTAVRVQLRAVRDELSLKIRDQGSGFEPGEARGRGGMGILNMEERTRLINGSFSLKAQPGKGVAVLVRVPLSQGRAR